MTTPGINYPSTAEMLSVIYEEIANKELAFGCKVKCKRKDVETGEKSEEEGILVNLLKIEANFYFDVLMDGYIAEVSGAKNIKPIGHPIMIGDVLDYISSKAKNIPHGIDSEEELAVVLWSSKREPIEMQSEECIAFVYELAIYKGNRPVSE